MFWTGSGRNGKNTLGDLIMRLLGDYAGAKQGLTAGAAIVGEADQTTTMGEKHNVKG